MFIYHHHISKDFVLYVINFWKEYKGDVYRPIHPPCGSFWVLKSMHRQNDHQRRNLRLAWLMARLIKCGHGFSRLVVNTSICWAIIGISVEHKSSPCSCANCFYWNVYKTSSVDCKVNNIMRKKKLLVNGACYDIWIRILPTINNELSQLEWFWSRTICFPYKVLCKCAERVL